MKSLSLQAPCPGALRRRSRRAALSVSASAAPPKKRIVITGLGVASVFGNDPVAFYDALLAGKSGISLIDRFDTSEYPTRFAGQIKDFRHAAGRPGRSATRCEASHAAGPSSESPLSARRT